MNKVNLTNLTVALLLTIQAASAKPANTDPVNWSLGSSELATKALTMQGIPDEDSEHELLYRTTIHLTATEVTTAIEEVTFYPSVAAVQSANNLAVWFESGVSELDITEAAVLSPSNELRRFDPKSAVIKDTDSYDVFTDTREVVMALPGLEPGAKTLLAFTRTTQRDELQLPWSTRVFPQVGYLRKLVEVTLTWDEDVDQPTWHNAFEGFNCTQTSLQLHCIAKDISIAKTDEDISYYDVWPQLQVSAAGSWEDIIQNELPGVMAAIEDTKLLDKTYDSLPESTTDPIAPLWDFSARKIRYVSFSAGEHGVLPHTANRTITELYGDCKDKSVVLLGLLRKQGVKASAALVSTSRYDPTVLKVPSGNYFNHMVVCLQDDAGNATRCLDPTDPYASSQGTTRGIQGNVALLLDPGSTPFAIPVDTYRWGLTINTSIVFDEDGNQVETIKRQYSDKFSNWVRGRLADRSPKERTEWLTENYHNIVSTSADPEITWAGIEDIESPITVTTTAKFKEVVKPNKNLSYREPLAWAEDLAETFEVENEHYYYDFPGVQVNSSYHFEIPQGWNEATVGPAIDLVTEFGEFARTSTIDGGNVVQVSRLELPARRLEVAEFKRFNKFLKAIISISDMDLYAKRAKK